MKNLNLRSAVIGALFLAGIVTLTSAFQPKDELIAKEQAAPQEDVKQQEPSLKKRVDSLEKWVLKAEARLARLEGLPQAKRAQFKLQRGWRNLKNWGRLKKGMGFAQVEAILGPANKKDTSSMGADCPLWYYEGQIEGVGPAVGSVQFFNRRVTSINKPVF